MKKKTITIAVFAILAFSCLGSLGTAFYYKVQTKNLAGMLHNADRTVDTLERNLLEKSKDAEKSSKNIADATESEANKLMTEEPLQLKIRQLEAELLSSANLIASLQAAQTNTPTDRPRRNRRDWMKDLKDSDPERYQEIMERREESRKNMHAAFASKAAHFLDRDTSDMTEEEVEEYNHMLSLLDETWRMADQLRADDLPREERWPIMREMRDNMRALSPMLDEERNREFYEIGTEFGYDETEALQFVEYMNNVMEITSMRSVFEAMGGGRRGGGSRSP